MVVCIAMFEIDLCVVLCRLHASVQASAVLEGHIIMITHNDSTIGTDSET